MTEKQCYQCNEPTNYLFDDGRCGQCTRLTTEEVQGTIMGFDGVVIRSCIANTRPISNPSIKSFTVDDLRIMARTASDVPVKASFGGDLVGRIDSAFVKGQELIADIKMFGTSPKPAMFIVPAVTIDEMNRVVCLTECFLSDTTSIEGLVKVHLPLI